MADLTIKCPKCKAKFPLSDSVRESITEDARAGFEASRVSAVEEAERNLRQEVTEKIKNEMRAATERFHEREEALEGALKKNNSEVERLKNDLKARDNAIESANQQLADVERQRRVIDAERREMAIVIEQQVSKRVADERSEVRRQEEEAAQLKLAEKSQLIESLEARIKDLNQRITQGSQQTQGEAFELELESALKIQFPHDTVEPVPKGEFGGDIIQRVIASSGLPCGSILWELKRTKTWSDGWLSKLRDDARAAKADAAILATFALPKGIEAFELIDGVWVCQPRLAINVCAAIRITLLELAKLQAAETGRETKQGIMYTYLTGPRFKQRVQAIAEAFSCLQEDLAAERKAFGRIWAKREAQIDRALQGTVGMYGDLQAIAGSALAEIESMSLPTTEA